MPEVIPTPKTYPVVWRDAANPEKIYIGLETHYPIIGKTNRADYLEGHIDALFCLADKRVYDAVRAAPPGVSLPLEGFAIHLPADLMEDVA